MIVKPYEEMKRTGDARRDAGHAAEKQMAFYLHRAFATHPELFVLNDIRIVDPDQQGFIEEDACQIDHLVLHRWGMFIIESKSCTGTVRIRDDGSGGDEWEFPTGRGSEGRGSPLSQARRQADYLRLFIQTHRESLLGKVPVGLRTLAKVVGGTDQRGVMHMPMQAIVAISERGVLNRTTWKPRTEPFADFVCKADQVVSKIENELQRHRKAFSLTRDRDGKYGLWSMKPDEVGGIATFLADRHQPLRHAANGTTPPERRQSSLTAAPAVVAPAPRPRDAGVPARASGAACKGCQGRSLSAQHGRYGYYWKCADCGVNTAMPRVCGVCGGDGAKGSKVRIRKEGAKYFRGCEACNIEECVWTEAAVGG